ncbi:hypothetical protein [Photobacterium kishitanii]|uniref:Uncharacterized protein n=1 Tax=Photobacterium kishitanii TaxID=318456 RepID=A0A2T3KKY7_9GAMM|nr:hypothetical protein [Photobacterium kishitanii]PSV00372.1 hypothetical protein C9J27_04390 [Photobacterium kishitanii]
MNNESNVKYRLIKDDGFITVLVEDGGVASIEQCEDEPEIRGDDTRSFTEYFQSRLDFSDPECDPDNIFEYVGQGEMYRNDFTEAEIDTPERIQDALSWLVIGKHKFIRDDSIFPQIK